MTSRSVLGVVAGALVATLGFAVAGASQQQSVWDGVYTSAQAKRVATLFTEKCAKCHGEDLTGRADSPPLAGAQFNSNWNDLSLNDVFEKTRIGMPDDEKGTLTRPQVADLIALILERGGFPAGKVELPTDAAKLREIKFLGSKP